MSNQRITILAMALLLPVLYSGCVHTAYGPNVGLLGIPIPVSPYLQDRLEDESIEHERYDRVPILGPITQGGPPKALDPPSDDEIMRAMHKARPIEGGIPFLWTGQWNNVRIEKELIADYVDPPRVYPLVGPAQLHHAHYKCTVYFKDTTHVGWPLPYTKRDEDSREVIYVDHDHLHMVGNVDGGPSCDF